MGATFTKRRLAEVNAAYEAFLAVGFPVMLDGNAETLQVSRDVDRTNWLTLLGLCDEAIAADLGDVTMALPIRCTSNANYALTYAEGAQIVRDLRTWAAAAQANWWRLKDAVNAAPTNAALRAIDLSEGWP